MGLGYDAVNEETNRFKAFMNKKPTKLQIISRIKKIASGKGEKSALKFEVMKWGLQNSSRNNTNFEIGELMFNLQNNTGSYNTTAGKLVNKFNISQKKMNAFKVNTEKYLSPVVKKSKLNNNAIFKGEQIYLNKKLQGKSPKEKEMWVMKRIGELSKLNDKEGMKTYALEYYLNSFGGNVFSNNGTFARKGANALNKMGRTASGSKRQEIANTFKKNIQGNVQMKMNIDHLFSNFEKIKMSNANNNQRGVKRQRTN